MWFVHGLLSESAGGLGVRASFEAQAYLGGFRRLLELEGWLSARCEDSENMTEMRHKT